MCLTMTDIPENALRARQMYKDRATIRAIKADTGLSESRLYHWLEGGPKTCGERLLPPIVRRLPRKLSSPEKKRAGLVGRLMRAAEQQVVAIERRLADTQQQPGDGERNARTLAVLAKTMQSLVALDVQDKPKATQKEKVPADDHDYDQIPEDIDALRRELTARMAAMAKGTSG